MVAVARPSPELGALSHDAPGEFIAVPADVSDPAAVREVFAVAAERGSVTTMIACAGSINALGPVAEVDPDLWWSAVAVDLRGTMLTAQAAVRAMTPGGGRIITVYGNLGDRGEPNLSAFATAKAGVARLTETLANEVRKLGVTVVGMHPGFVRTPMTERIARSDEGRRWLPGFAARAEQGWGSGETATRLLDQILSGAADELAGRVLHAGDDLAQLARLAATSDDLRRLRLQLEG